MRRRLLCALGFALAGCGLQQVELASAPEGEIIVLDPVAEADLARLRAAPERKPEPGLEIAQPDDDSAIPENIAPLEIVLAQAGKMGMEAMKEPAPARAFELHLRSESASLRLYTTHAQAAVPALRWGQWLAQHQGGAFELVARALVDRDRVLTSKTVHVQVRARTAADLYSYWSDAPAEALRASLASCDEHAAAPEYPGVAPWQSFSDDQRSQARIDHGLLTVTFDGQVLATPWSADWQLEQASWAADGSALVFAGTPLPVPDPVPPLPGMTMPGMARPERVGASTIASLHPLAQGWSEAQIWASAEGPDQSVRAPAFSPDGQWVAFERAKGADRVGRLWLVRSGGSDEKALSVKMGWKGEGAWPTWLASSVPGESWLLFSRPQTLDKPESMDEASDLWALALAPDASGVLQPVGAPFHLPCQGAQETRRRAIGATPAPR